MITPSALHTRDILDRVKFPSDMKALSDDQLKTLAAELRGEVIDAVSVTGGHLGAGLGVVELTVALHHVFDTPRDRTIWDVGHQAYPHKILTGRREKSRTLRKTGGISGFTKRSESQYDPFGAGHSSTSISAGLGMAVARDLLGEKAEPDHVIAVIGDSAMTGGMAYEAMNNAGDLKSRLIVILNDNDMSIARPTGALSAHLSRVVSSKPYRNLRAFGKSITQHMPGPFYDLAKKAEGAARNIVGGTLFENMGFYYIGPIDGHNMDDLLTILRNVRDWEKDGPVLIHVVTQKGFGYAPAESAPDKLHAVKTFDVVTGKQNKKKSNKPSYSSVFAGSLEALAEKDPRVVVITAAMPDGTGLKNFAQKFPSRFFDVGIAEQHAVTFAAGMACEGLKPFVAIYSTFLQRAYDQIVHDVAIQKLPVRFAIDRAGLVGADGATHAGSFDIAYLGCVPNMVLMASSDEAELAAMVTTAHEYDDGPIAFRFPRGEGVGIDMPGRPEALAIGKGRVLREGTKAAILSYGTRLNDALLAADTLAEQGIDVTVADARFAKPLDTELLQQLVQHHPALITIEEGSVGGFGSLVAHELAHMGVFDHGLIFRSLTLPDSFLDHAASQQEQYAWAGIDAKGIVEAVRDCVPLSKIKSA